MSAPLLAVDALTVDYRVPGRGWWRGAERVRALDGVSFTMAPGEIVGVVGESGSGKSTLARAIPRLLPVTAGSVRFEGEELQGADERLLRTVRRRMQVVFQDPNGSLNPRMTVADNVAEGLLLHGMRSRRERHDCVVELLSQVGLPAEALGRYPHAFSGGQRQRIGIARALAVNPVLLIADEPVSALDLSVQAQVLNLLLEQQERRQLALLFIGHDLGVIRHCCDRVLVLYRGRIVESGPTEAVLADPRHPYTRALTEASPVSHPRLRRVRSTPENAGGGVAAPGGCAFATRCAQVLPACLAAPPPLRTFGARAVACLRAELAPDGPGNG